ncbi:MAG: preprotein translocase subunit SecE [Candidatus Brocadiia bacterium]
MEIYKKGQAKNYRVAFAALILLFAVYSAYEWYFWANGLSESPNMNTIVQWGGAAVCLFLGGLFAFLLAFVNRRTVDYVVTTEEEMRKVTWPTKDELISSSIIVVVVMVIIGLVVTSMDYLFSHVLTLLR